MSEFYEETRNPSIIYTDRYKNCTLLRDKDTGEVLLASRNIPTVRKTPNDIYHRIKSNEVCRLDILAHMYYKNPLLWWIIAEANNISDPFSKIETGVLLRIPDIEVLYGNRGLLL